MSQRVRNYCRFSAITFFGLNEPELKNHAYNRLEDWMFDRKPYFKAVNVFKFEKFLPQTKLDAKTINFDTF